MNRDTDTRTGGRILLVEDNPGDVRLVRMLLEEAAPGAWTCAHAETLRDAAAALSATHYDVVLVDLSLPDAWGLEAVSRIQKLAPEAPLVVLSGQRNEAVAVQAVQQGAQDYLMKGADGVRLVRALRYAIERKRSEQRLVHQAHHDALTGLPNRTLLHARLDQALAQLDRSTHQIALLFLDLDKFKAVNDTLGHDVGDALLQSVAKRLLASVRSDDTVARLAGDEFVVLLRGLRHASESARVAEAIVQQVCRPHQCGKTQVTVGVSIGITAAAGPEHDAPTLIKQADLALYETKRAGGAHYRFFGAARGASRGGVSRGGASGAMSRAAPTPAHDAGAELLNALAHEQLELHYQPQFELASGRVLAMEGLLRWPHPRRGELRPGAFLDPLEDAAIRAAIGDRVVELACRQARDWRGRGLGVPVTVNLALQDLLAPRLVARLREALDRHGLPGAALRVEVNGVPAPAQRNAAAARLGELHALGVPVLVENFGSHTWALTDLVRLRIDALSLEQTLVASASGGPEAALIGSLVALAHSLRLKVLGKGVETPLQADRLRASGCDAALGHHLAPPLPAAVALDWLQAHSHPPTVHFGR